MALKDTIPALARGRSPKLTVSNHHHRVKHPLFQDSQYSSDYLKINKKKKCRLEVKLLLSLSMERKFTHALNKY